MRVTSTNRLSGFTLVELMVVMAVLGILISLVLVTLDSLYQSNIDSMTQTVQTADTRSVLRTIENDISISPGFLKTTSMAVVTPTGPDDAAGNWNYAGNDPLQPNNRVLIVQIYGTDKAPSDPTRSLIYANSAGSCDPTAGALPLVNNLIYFVKKDPTTNLYNLYRRTMIGANPCATPAQKQTCSAAKVKTAPCQGNDAILLYNVDNFTVDYYTAADPNIPIPDQYGAGDITSAKSVKLTVTTKRRINNQLTPYASSLKISRIN